MQSSAETGMQQAVQALFDRMAARGPDPSLQDTTGTCLFEIDQCGRWYVTFDGGSVTVSRNATPSTCTIMCGAADFVEMVEGRQNMITAVLQGRVRARGDLTLGLSFRRLQPVAP